MFTVVQMISLWHHLNVHVQNYHYIKIILFLKLLYHFQLFLRLFLYQAVYMLYAIFNILITMYCRVLQKDKTSTKQWVCFGNMFIKMPSKETKLLLEKGKNIGQHILEFLFALVFRHIVGHKTFCRIISL